MSEDKSRAKNRPQRTPMHNRRILEAKQRKGFVRRWVNEDHGRVDAALEAGYTFVYDDDADASTKRSGQDASQMGSVVRRVVNKDPNASINTAVLMEIPQEFYDEDQKAKADQLDREEMAWNPKEIAKKNPEIFGEMTKN